MNRLLAAVVDLDSSGGTSAMSLSVSVAGLACYGLGVHAEAVVSGREIGHDGSSLSVVKLRSPSK